jgi:cell division protein FtsI (penicillin-binding protein 3)
VSEIKEWNKTIVKMKKSNPQICSTETLLKLKAVLKNVVKKRSKLKGLLDGR